jgi:hypothetical protein
LRSLNTCYACRVVELPEELLAESDRLFHDVDPANVDAEANAGFVIARVLDRGTMRSVRALFQYYGRERILGFLKAGGIHRLASRTVPLWLAYFDLDLAACTPKPSVRPKSICWKG